MGGRGASSGIEVSKRTGKEEPVPYGSSYETLAEFGKFKVVIGTPDSLGRYNASPMESQTPNRKYIYLRKNEDFASIVHIGRNGKRYKEVSMPHIGEPDIHFHYGYIHNEYTKGNKWRKPSQKELNKIKYVQEKLRELRIGV